MYHTHDYDSRARHPPSTSPTFAPLPTTPLTRAPLSPPSPPPFFSPRRLEQSWKDWGMFAVDGLSGRYLYVVWRGGAGAPAAASSNVEKKKSFRRNGVGVVDAICKEE